MKNIYVGNLSYNATENQVKDLFAEFGEVASVRIIKDKFTGNSKGFAFVEMPANDEAEQAISSLDGKEIGGRNIKVNEARPREERPVRRGPRHF
ncbi:RNA-binding protein [Candidatus Dependentiae bacterium]|nr:RNA-binding protein [Candidatus Dependentiae bacterium]